MKTLVVLICIAISIPVFGQINVEPAIANRYIYCELVGQAPLGSLTKPIITVDYGNAFDHFTGGKTIRDESGKMREFNSLVDALNFMAADGWEYVQGHVISQAGSVVTVSRWLLKKKLEPSTSKDSDRKTPLMLAASIGDLAKIQNLISANVDINAKDVNGRTALFYAGTLNQMAALTTLIGAGADVEVKDRNGYTLMRFAKENKKKELIEALRNVGAKE